MALLNQSRNDALKSRRLGRYPRYAMGEMLIIIAGIVTAVQINNWNEARIAEESMK